jgi:hypothetical protein
MKSIARKIVMFLKKRDMNIHDWSHTDRDECMWFYNWFYTEYKDKLKTIPNLEITSIGNNFNFIFELDYAYKNIPLHINDLPWFLTRNRYLINKNCKHEWYYDNMKYFFKDQNDYLKMIKIFSKTNNVTSK